MPRGAREAIARALAFEDREIAETRWSDEAFAETRRYGGVRRGSRLVDSRSIASVPSRRRRRSRRSRRSAARPGWYKGALLWRLRGLLDVLVGGPGLRRGRRDPVGLRVGDTLDFWRVEAFEPDRLLRLSAEMKVPGRAWLQFEVAPRRRRGLDRLADGDLRSRPGSSGSSTGTRLWPFHGYIFGGMLRNLARPRRTGTDVDAPVAASQRMTSHSRHEAVTRS